MSEKLIRQIHELQPDKKIGAGELTPEEIRVIAGKADIKRLQFDLKKNLADMKTLDEPRFSGIVKILYEEMNTTSKERVTSEEAKKKSLELSQRAEKIEDTQPELAAYLYAKAVKMEVIGGCEFSQNIDKVKNNLEKIKNTPKSCPSQLLPHAIFLGIQKLLSEKQPLPKIDKIINDAVQNKEILKNYALILSEKERANFVASFPEEQRFEVTLVLDNSISEILPEAFAKTEDEINQRAAIMERMTELLREKLAEAPDDFSEKIGLLIQTLMNLQGDDATRSLARAGARGLSNPKDAKRQKNQENYTAQVVEKLLRVDTEKGGALTIKFLSKKGLSTEMFKKFYAKLLAKKVLTEKSEKFFNDEKNWKILKKMLAEYPNQFNTVMDTLAEIKNYSLADNEKEIFQAIADLDSITPIIFERYRQADAKGKKELAEKLKELKPKFFRNQPIRDILPKKDREILAEIVYLAYQPIGMSFSDVRQFIEEVQDHTGDLEGFKFPEDGYDFRMDIKKSYVLKPGERLDVNKISAYRDLFTGKIPQTDEEIVATSKLLETVAKAGSDFETKALAALLGLLGSDQMVRGFVDRSKKLNEKNVYMFLNDLKEILGVYFTDNYHERLKNFMSANPKVEGRIVKILSEEKRQATLKKKLAKDGESINWDNVAKREEAAKVLSVFIQTKALKLIRENIYKALNKFIEIEIDEQEEAEGEQISEKKKLKAYISKNVGSFFAKASAGICTAQDVDLFDREDHFHINIVEDEQYVRGNIQAYIIDDPKGGRSLVLRGFNPNSSFLEKINPGAFCEAVLKVARRFQKDNDLSRVFITEHLSGWHALSNREAVANYLKKKYVNKKKEKAIHLQITGSQRVNYLYEVQSKKVT